MGGRSLLRATLRAQRRGLVVGVLVGLLWSAAKVAVPVLVQQAIDKGIDERRGSLVAWSLLIAAAGLVAAVFTGMRRWFAFREARWAETVLRDRLFAHLQRLHLGFHDRAQTGQLMSRANTDLQQVQGFVVLIPITVANLFTCLAAAIVLLVYDPVLALLALVTLPAINVLATRFSKAIHPRVMRVQQESAELATVVEETVAGVRVVKGFGAEPLQAARLRDEAEDILDASIDAARVRANYLPALDALPTLALVAVLWYGGHQVIDGRLSLGQLVAFNSYLVLLVWPLRMLGQFVAQGQRALASAERVAEVLSTGPAITDAPHPRRLAADGPPGAIAFEDVRFAYGDGPPVLDGFTLAIRPGESVALVGATGSGKSTIARLLARFSDVDAGRILVDGVDVREIRLHDLRRAIGIVFEDTFLFNDTVAANIAFADPGASREDIERAARLAGAHEFITRLPDGYATQIGERGFSLSGGQRQRIAIARAVLADPRVLILDDATSAVDPSKEHEIREALATVMAGRTTLVIAHRPATIALASRVVLVDGGRVAADGTHDALLAESERYREVLAAGERARWAGRWVVG